MYVVYNVNVFYIHNLPAQTRIGHFLHNLSINSFFIDEEFNISKMEILSSLLSKLFEFEFEFNCKNVFS